MLLLISNFAINAHSPKGKIVRYLQGVQQLPSDIAMAIKEAREERVSQPLSLKTLHSVLLNVPQAIF